MSNLWPLERRDLNCFRSQRPYADAERSILFSRLYTKIGQERIINASCDYNHTAKKVTQDKAWSMSTGAE